MDIGLLHVLNTDEDAIPLYTYKGNQLIKYMNYSVIIPTHFAPSFFPNIKVKLKKTSKYDLKYYIIKPIINNS